MSWPRALAVGLLLGGAAGCLQAWPVVGPYRCSAGSCPDGLLCDDGLCCSPTQAPLCRTLVLDGGTCADGSAPRAYYLDLDGDGFGDPNGLKEFCAKPVETAVSSKGDDCDDAKADVHPGAKEQCNGLDDNCNGEVDEGTPTRMAFFRDEDGDGYGNPDAGVQACQAPPGTVSDSSDCDDRSVTRYPLAAEQCNGLDDNCDGKVDEGTVVGTGLSCSTGKKGACAVGSTACVMGKKTCVAPTPKALDLCDGVDNDCDGQVDEHPDCGGPAGFIAEKQFVSVQGLAGTIPFPEQTSHCMKDFAGSTGASAWNAPTWSGPNANYQLWFAEAPAGKTWDLTKPNLKLHLALSWTATGTGDPWSGAEWPVIYFCDENSNVFLRLVRTTGLLANGSGSFSTDIALNLASGDKAWIYGNATNPPDVRRIKRIEVMAKVQTGTFTITWSPDAGFTP